MSLTSPSVGLRRLSVVLFAGLAACNASDGTGTASSDRTDGGGGTIGSGGFGGGSGTAPGPTAPAPVPPGYAQGFEVTELGSIGVVTVVEVDGASGTTRTTRASSSPEASYRVVYAPLQDRLEITSEGRTFAGATDGEARAFTNGSDGRFGGAAPNFAQVQTGTWAYAVSAMIDAPGDTFRHTLSIAGGAAFDLPADGRGTYGGELVGTIESFTATTSRTVPFVAPGSVSVDFGSGRVEQAFTLDPARSGVATGTVTGTGTLQPDATFRGAATADLTVDGASGAPTGEFVGGVAGPSQQEAAGVVSVALPDGGLRSMSATGAFLGVDPSR